MFSRQQESEFPLVRFLMFSFLGYSKFSWYTTLTTLFLNETPPEHLIRVEMGQGGGLELLQGRKEIGCNPAMAPKTRMNE